RAKVSNDEHGQHGWVHVRQSIHNPNIAVNLQSSVQGGCLSMARDFRDDFLKASGVDAFLDIAQIDKFVENGPLA
ncbi:phosphoglucosamine mutase, partial [Trifolium pratense]